MLRIHLNRQELISMKVVVSSVKAKKTIKKILTTCGIRNLSVSFEASMRIFNLNIVITPIIVLVISVAGKGNGCI